MSCHRWGDDIVNGGLSKNEHAIIDRLDAGMNADQIAAETGIDPRRVRNIIKKLGAWGDQTDLADALATTSEAFVEALRRHHPDRCGA